MNQAHTQSYYIYIYMKVYIFFMETKHVSMTDTSLSISSVITVLPQNI